MATFLCIAQHVYAADLQDCMVRALQLADDTTTVGQLRQRCKEEVEKHTSDVAEETTKAALPVQERISQDRKNALKPFTIMAHKPNYILPVAYNPSGYDLPDNTSLVDSSSLPLDNAEVQFQISLKVPLLIDIFEYDFDLYAAYTNHSFWQLYNDSSSPFRESNHEPEAWLQFSPGWNIFGFSNAVNAFGIVHQSNGRGGSLSRSWNRIFANFIFERGNVVFSIKPWYRLPEDRENDDNPDITDYLGHFQLGFIYRLDDHIFQFMSRNNIESGFERGSIEASWSFPLWDYPFVKGYIQLFSGYGESLLDYNNYVNKIGFGFAFTDWL